MNQCLGLYVYDSDHQCYKQLCSEQYSQHISRYLYRASNNMWCISETPGDIKRCWMHNPSKNETIPTTGWLYWSRMTKQWLSDASLKIKVGGIPNEDQCKAVLIKLRGEAADKWPKATGLFAKTNNYYNGKPVFENNYGWYLYSATDGLSTWSVGPNIGKCFISSTSD